MLLFVLRNSNKLHMLKFWTKISRRSIDKTTNRLTEKVIYRITDNVSSNATLHQHILERLSY